MPLNGRQFLQLAELTPGVQRTTVGYMEYSGGSISANGMSDHANNTMVDGVMNQESGAARMNFSPSIDLIQEFKIQTNVYDSEFGRSGGAQINIVTKRGSLDYHGAIYMFHRNDNHEARNFFARRIPEFRPESVRRFVRRPYSGLRKRFSSFSTTKASGRLEV